MGRIYFPIRILVDDFRDCSDFPTSVGKSDIRLFAVLRALQVAIVGLSFSILLNPIIAKVNAFGLIQMSMALSLGGASFYFVLRRPD